MVTIAVLLVGVLGTVALIDGANATTVDNKAREGATGLAREMIEATRSIPYPKLGSSAIAAELQTRPALADSSGAPGYTVARRGFTYTVTIDACSLDDPADGLGSHDVAVTFCADSAGPLTPAKDRNTDDYRRVAVRLDWQGTGRAFSTRQSTLITNPVGGLGPTVKTLGGPTAVTDPATTSLRYDVTTSSTPATLEWSVNGDVKGVLTPSSTSAAFDWVLEGGPQPAVLDGSYLLRAQAFDADGRSGSARVLTVTINRKPGATPAGFAGGRNGNGADVDVEWRANGEGDVLGYRVYRTDAGGVRIARACPPAASSDQYLAATSCVDQAAPATGPLYYVVHAIDTAPGGALREGVATSPLTVADGNTVPSTPAGLTACSGGDPGCNGPDGLPAPAGTTVLTWSAATDPDADAISFYRIYRDGTGYAARLDRLYSTGGALVYVDGSPGGVAHDYRVSAVDARFGESALSTAVTR